MGNQSDPTQPRHPIQVVAKRTGLTADVLRAWERRYGAVVPGRSASRRRLYSDADIARLALLRQATEAGRSIGQLAELSDGELRRLVAEDLSAAVGQVRPVDSGAANATQPFLESALSAVHALDGGALQSTLNRASLVLSPGDLIERLVVPLMRHVGDRWYRGELSIAHEHLATAVVRGMLSDLALTRTPMADGPSVVVATPANQMHELGALVVAATAAGTGWHVTYLGANVPAEDIAVTVERIGASAIALSVSHPNDDPALRDELRDLRARVGPGVAVLAGGAAAPDYGDAMKDIGALVLGDMPSLRAVLLSLRTEPGAKA
ncbi:MAG: MerR family transcriptional regulator [Gemmatimonadota bacterium]|nr:MerR family transcriptional regulator [Gemmatimonadota bacterium]